MLSEEVTVGILKSTRWAPKSSENQAEVSGKYIRQEEVGGSENWRARRVQSSKNLLRY